MLWLPLLVPAVDVLLLVVLPLLVVLGLLLLVVLPLLVVLGLLLLDDVLLLLLDDVLLVPMVVLLVLLTVFGLVLVDADLVVLPDGFVLVADLLLVLVDLGLLLTVDLAVLDGLLALDGLLDFLAFACALRISEKKPRRMKMTRKMTIRTTRTIINHIGTLTTLKRLTCCCRNGTSDVRNKSVFIAVTFQFPDAKTCGLLA